jgi:DNA-binding GntR family transcriptional regulator
MSPVKGRAARRRRAGRTARSRPAGEPSLVEKIRLHLEDRIIAGHLKPRERLIEEEIAREFAVSRSPVREALRGLERDGLVVMAPARGACVADLTATDIDDVYAVRARLGGLLFALATPPLGTAALDRLAGIVDVMERAVRDQDVQRYFHLDLEFEEVVIGACSNRKLVAIWRSLGRPILRFRFFSLLAAGRLHSSLQYHRDLVAAFRRHDAEAADRLVQETIAVAGAALRDHLAHGLGYAPASPAGRDA